MRLRFANTAAAVLSTLLASGVHAAPLRVCVPEDSAPYSTVERGKAHGLDVALMQAVAKRLDRPLELTWFEGRFDKEGNLSLDARALLAAGACDFVAGIPLYEPHLAPMIADKARTPDYPGAKPLRQRPYQTLVPVKGGAAYRATAMVLVGRSGSAARGLEDLQGHSVAVRAGSMASLAVGAWRNCALASSIKGYNLREDVLSAVETGEAEYAFVDVAVWDRYRSQHPATVLVQSGFEHPVKMNIGLLAKASDADVLEHVSAAVAQELAASQVSALSRQEQATWILPVAPVVRPLLTMRDFASPGS